MREEGLFSYSMLGIIRRVKSTLDVHMPAHTGLGGSMVIRLTMKLQNTYDNKLKLQLTSLWRRHILLSVEFCAILF